MKKIIFLVLFIAFSNSIFSQVTVPVEPGEEDVWYRDADGDGLGNSEITYRATSQPNGYVPNSLDCDDTNPNIKAKRIWFKDNDGDGYGSMSQTIFACISPSGYVDNSSDCDDNNATLPKYFYRDNDGDGYGIISNKLLGCSAPSGYVDNSSDCNDSNASLPRYWYVDSDEDGYGSEIGTLSCVNPSETLNYSNQNGDCNDNNPNIKPGALEICDGIDNDCDGQIDEAPKPSTPSTPTVTKNCGSTVLKRGTPPSGITWYWQSSSSGTTTTNSSTSITRTSGTVYYLRARNNATGCWGNARTVSYTINTVPSVPTNSTVTKNCGNTVLTKGSSPSGITWYWQSSSSGTSTSNSNTSITRTSGTVYYLRARNNTSGCWSSARSVSYSINTVPSTPSIPTITKNCGNTVLTRDTPPSGITWYWQSSSSGTSTGNSNTSITRTSGTVYYLRARNNTTGCWSGVRSISYSINKVPSTPSAPTITQNCGNTVLTKGSSPSGITWYWQSSSSGTSTSNSNTSITRTSGTVYYLRARNSTSGCWSSVRSVSYSIDFPSTWYADTDGDGYGDANNTTSACGIPSRYVSNNNDYDDSTVNITNIAPQRFYLDADGDGFGDPNNSVYYSVKPVGYVTNNTDNCPNEAGTNNGCSYTPPVFSNENYVFTREYQEPMTNPTGITQNKDVLESITYFDGLGRAKQSIAIQAGGILTNNEEPKDIVTHIEYDEFGRQTKEYLPYAVETANGAIITGDVASATKSYYQVKHSEDFAGVNLPDVNAYSEKQFEGSPLNRILKQAAPGKDWKLGNGHEIEFDYSSNISGEVKSYYVTTSFANNTYTPSLGLSAVNDGNYATGELYKTVTKDENHGGATSKLHTTEEFKNKQGQVVLKRTYAIVTDGSSSVVENHDTYYVYDDFRNLTYVLPPMIDASTNTLAVINSKLDDLGYQYKYDHRNRLVEKKIPGKGWEYIIYDKLDRPVLTQDTKLKAQNKWLFTKYDALGRVIYTGIYTHGSVITREAIQTYFDSQNNSKEKYYEVKLTSAGTLGVYYSSDDFPNTNLEVLTINYYDSYVFDRAGANTSVSGIYGVNSTGNLKSLATGSRVKVLDSSPAKWITTVTYYDEKARPIYVYSKNEELQTTDIVESKLDFSGKVLESKTTHKKSGKADIVTIDSFEYDHVGRMTKQTQKINSQDTETIVANEYDDLGQLKTKKVGGALQEVDYAYNVRGWLKNINEDGKNDNDLFNFTINYNKPQNGATPLFNGNIAETSWNTLNVDTSTRGYSYKYDALNRIVSATGTPNTNYNVSGITYDKNGNIITLNRNGWQNTSSYANMDILSYEYHQNTNQLKNVNDTGNANYGFKDGSELATEYTYDANGNILTDANKNITSVEYNHLNMPTKITVTGTNAGVLQYKYSADGVKLRKIKTQGVTSTTTDYANGYTYVNNELQYFPTLEGYVTKDNTGFKYVYQYKDHLGNVRLSYTDNNNDGIIQTGSNTEIIEESNYYPFGLKHKGYNNVTSSLGNSTAQKFKYNGIEYEETLGLDLYEMDVRSYDPAIGRFTSIDPVTHWSNSTYNAFDNNPVFWADPSGADAESFFNKLFKDSKSGDKWVNNNGTFTNQRTGQSETCDDCKEGQSKDSKKVVGFGAHSFAVNAKKYYHTGGGTGANKGWHYESEYNDVLDKIALTLINGNASEGTISWINNLDDVVYNKLMKRVGIVERRIAAYNHYMMSGYTEPMNMDSPIFFGTGLIGNVGGIANLGKSLTFAEYKAARGGTQTLAKISTSTGTQRISTEYHHLFITQRLQTRLSLPNWMVNNRLNVIKLNTVQHSLIDSYRFRFLRKGFKSNVGWTKKYNWFTKF